METDRSKLCGCKGIRTCLQCEKEYGITKPEVNLNDFKVYTYCPTCNYAIRGAEEQNCLQNAHEGQDSIGFPGVFIKSEFLSQEEETQLITALDFLPWSLSQSGRRKQNFGPKCNFKKKKLNLGDFNGFPKSTQFVQEKFSTVDLMKGYQTIEQCTLEYDPKRGASIDPHIDDCWIWGNRIVTVNLLSDSVLTMTPYRGDMTKYNLQFVPEKYVHTHPADDIKEDNIAVRIPMPRRSLLIIYGQARYWWEHMVLREDISERRLCIAYREFTPPYLKGGTSEQQGQEILEKAQIFW